MRIAIHHNHKTAPMSTSRAYSLPLFLLLASAMVASAADAAAITPLAVKGTYWPSWLESTFPPSAIDTTLFTHVYFAFLEPNNITYEIVVPSSTAPIISNFTSTLHRKNPPVKTLFSIGGGGSNSALFAGIAADPSKRRRFIKSTIDVARKFGFDGMDLDWESPQSPTEMTSLGLLLRDWRAALQKEAAVTSRSRLLLTAAVYFSPVFILAADRRSFPVGSMGRNLDLINVMCYDYHGSWDTSKTGAHAALYDPTSNISTSYGLTSWVRAGAPRSKLVMGLPLYGRTWTLKDAASNGIGAPAVGVGPGSEGTLTYGQVVDFNTRNGATVVYDTTTVSTYSAAGTSWIGYDDTRSASAKVRYAKGLGLRGYFFWAVHGDSKWDISREASKTWASYNQ